MPIHWGAQYQFGIPIIDDQHQMLVSLTNRLHEAVARPRAKAELRRILKSLRAYAVGHFAFEENLLAEASYFKLVAHRKEHVDFVSQMNKSAKEIDKGSPDAVAKLANFLDDWLAHHIDVVDRQYLGHLKGKIELK